MESTTTHESTQKLVADFMRPREIKAPQAAPEQPAQTVIPNTDDFNMDGLKPPPDEPEAQPEIPADVKPEKIADKFLDTLDETDIYIGMYDGAQSAFFTDRMKRRVKKKITNTFEEVQILCRKISKGVLKEKDLTEDQLRDYFIVQNFIDNKEFIPLSDKEYNSLKRHVSKVVEQNGGKMPPGVGIMLSLVTTTMKRIQLLNE